jgi:hypothetical protein
MDGHWLGCWWGVWILVQVLTVFEVDPSVGVSMSSVAHAVCVEEACALVKADCSGANMFTF